MVNAGIPISGTTFCVVLENPVAERLATFEQRIG